MDTQKADQPFDRLTRLCAQMTTTLDEALEAEKAQGVETNLTPVKVIVFLEDEVSSGVVIHGYEDSTDAMASLFLHMKAIFEAHGKSLEFVAIPDSPEGMNP